MNHYKYLGRMIRDTILMIAVTMACLIVGALVELHSMDLGELLLDRGCCLQIGVLMVQSKNWFSQYQPPLVFWGGWSW
jgi:hypothetical protein